MAKIVWEDLPERKNCFTTRNAIMVDLDTGKVVQFYVANTKIAVIQKCKTEHGTYYRTSEAALRNLNYAIKATYFGLPNEKAPSAHNSRSNSLHNKTLDSESATRINSPIKKQKTSKKVSPTKDGEKGSHFGWIKKIFRRKNG